MIWRNEIFTNGEGTPYLTRYSIGPLCLHIFHRGDTGRKPHDHPYDFWSVPFHAYLERVFNTDDMSYKDVVVPAWRLNQKRAEHTHIVLGRADGKAKPFYSLMWRFPNRRKWGFWVSTDRNVKSKFVLGDLFISNGGKY